MLRFTEKDTKKKEGSAPRWQVFHSELGTGEDLMQATAIVAALHSQHAESASDTELVHRAKAGDLAAFETLVERYERRVYTLARRMLHSPEDAEDVTQQTFLNALEYLNGFREEASFYTWLMRIATHAALKVKRKRRPTVSLENLADPQEGYDTIPHPEFIADWRAAPERLLEKAETKRLLDDALEELDDKYRMVFLLRDVEGLSINETASALGVSQANVKARLLRARLQLRERLTRAFGDEARRASPAHAH
jgi:RNA polymerase sigma-70 factor (ECF subfamily)